MQTTDVLGLVLCFGVAFALIAGAGAGAMFGESPGDSEASRTIDDLGGQADTERGEDDEGGVVADVVGDNEPTLTGVVISGGSFVVQLVGAVVLLPITLTRLGFPTYFAFTLGPVAQVIAFVGLLQFLGRTELL